MEEPAHEVNPQHLPADDDGSIAAPIWLGWHEPEVADLSDHELAEYVAYWHGRREGYASRRAAVGKDHPDAYRWGFSGWWCSKKESIGLREIERRRIRRERGEQG